MCKLALSPVLTWHDRSDSSTVVCVWRWQVHFDWTDWGYVGFCQVWRWLFVLSAYGEASSVSTLFIQALVSPHVCVAASFHSFIFLNLRHKFSRLQRVGLYRFIRRQSAMVTAKYSHADNRPFSSLICVFFVQNEWKLCNFLSLCFHHTCDIYSANISSCIRPTERTMSCRFN